MTVEGPDLYSQLRASMENEGQTELECRSFLSHAKDLLVKVTPIAFLAEADEYRGHSGDSDYIVVCEVCDEAGIPSNQAYIWEAKAPQCYVFEQDTQNRVRPSKDFISAENQLLHYYEESKGSDQFRSEFGITHPENVKLGGIIIGSRRTLVKNTDYNADMAFRLYARALDLRRRYLYGHSGIKIMIWDTVLEHLQRSEPVRRIVLEPVSSAVRVVSDEVRVVIDNP